MSDCVVKFTQATSVKPHPNADALDVCEVLGYQVVVQKGTVDDKALGIYFPPDTLIPEKVSSMLGIKKYLVGANEDRVNAIKLRGEVSFGVFIPVNNLGHEFINEYVKGDITFDQNLAEVLGCIKYAPPVKPTIGNTAKSNPEIDPYFSEFTKIQNGKLYTNIFTPGEPVIVTEKIHGSNCRVGIVNRTLVVGSHHLRRDPGTNMYWGVLSNTKGLLSMLLNWSNNSKDNVIIHGEVYGYKVQSLTYDTDHVTPNKFRVFGIEVNGEYLDFHIMEKFLSRYGVECVPVLARIPFDLAEIKKLSCGNSTLSGHIREGCVVYPENERTHPKIGRVVLKYIGDEYFLSKHKAKEVTEE